MDLLRRVKQYMQSHTMVQTESTILIGLSGGADSVCLLYVLKELAQEFNTISETEKAPEHNGVYFFVSDGDNWDSAMAYIYFIDDENGGVFRLTARFFGEASEGHGNRFRQMIDTFKVIH